MDFSALLIFWYRANKRDLPWRNTNDPYKIWLSEVILQQTRVDQGHGYYIRFTDTFPNVHSLAKATETEVLKLWQGLGYYSRARNLHRTAREISLTMGGVFPLSSGELQKLKGIGKYTSAAIASFAYGEKVAVVDGNVYRVLSRIFGIYTPFDSTAGQREFRIVANGLLPKDSSEHNQAIMEFGALHCKPKQPLCGSCPFAQFCHAHNNKAQEKLPVRSKKTAVLTRHFNYLVLNYQDSLYLKKRSGNDIWEGLYDFPMLETNEALEFPNDLVSFAEAASLPISDAVFQNRSKTYRHKLTHREIRAIFWNYRIMREPPSGYSKINSSENFDYPIPRLIDLYLKENIF